MYLLESLPFFNLTYNYIQQQKGNHTVSAMDPQVAGSSSGPVVQLNLKNRQQRPAI